VNRLHNGLFRRRKVNKYWRFTLPEHCALALNILHNGLHDGRLCWNKCLGENIALIGMRAILRRCIRTCLPIVVRLNCKAFRSKHIFQQVVIPDIARLIVRIGPRTSLLDLKEFWLSRCISFSAKLARGKFNFLLDYGARVAFHLY
jgi:hypothetical protein